MTLYATPAELAHYLDPDASAPEVPPLATVLLRHASSLVAGATAAAVYRVDAEGLPADTKLREALRDATCEQAGQWSLHGLDPRKGATQLTRLVASKSLNGASVSYEANAAAQAALNALASGDELTAAAWAILDNAGLISSRISSALADYGRAYDITPTSPFVLGDATLGS